MAHRPFVHEKGKHLLTRIGSEKLAPEEARFNHRPGTDGTAHRAHILKLT